MTSMELLLSFHRASLSVFLARLHIRSPSRSGSWRVTKTVPSRLHVRDHAPYWPYCAIPLPNDQFSFLTSTRLLKTSSVKEADRTLKGRVVVLPGVAPSCQALDVSTLQLTVAGRPIDQAAPYRAAPARARSR